MGGTTAARVGRIDHIKGLPSAWLLWRLPLQMLGHLGHWHLWPLALIPEGCIVQPSSFLFRVHRRVDLANHPRGITGNDMISRHLLRKNARISNILGRGIFAITKPAYLGNDASSAYRGSLADPHARQDDRVSANPAILFDDDLLSQLGALRPVTQRWVQWMCCTVKGDIGADEGSRTNADKARVEKSGIEVDEYVGANPEVRAIVDFNGGFYERLLTE